MAFHFFAHPTNPGPDADGFSRLFSLCVAVIQTATNMTMSQQTALPSVSQSFIDRTIALAGFSILRLVRSSLAQHLDLGVGEQAFSQAVQFLKNVSLQPGDIGVRTALIMRDLWNSSRVFRRKDGRMEPLALRLRTRLSMSVSYDMFWYWREEFGNMQNPYNGEDATLPSNDATQPNTPRKLCYPHSDSILTNRPSLYFSTTSRTSKYSSKTAESDHQVRSKSGKSAIATTGRSFVDELRYLGRFRL